MSVASLALASTALGGSITIGFQPLGNSSSASASKQQAPATPSNSLTWTVSDAGNGKVNFEVRNQGTQALAVTNIYFDDLVSRQAANGQSFSSPQVLGNLVAINGSPGVSMITNGASGDPYTMQMAAMGPSQGSTPPPLGFNPYPELPGGAQQYLPFQTSASVWEFSAGNYNSMGVNPGQWVDLTFLLAPNRTFQDVVSDISNGYGLRAGLLVQGAVPLGSQMQSYQSSPVPVPVPPALAGGSALLAGIAGISLVRRRLLGSQRLGATA